MSTVEPKIIEFNYFYFITDILEHNQHKKILLNEIDNMPNLKFEDITKTRNERNIKILSKEIPSEIIYETERVFAINDINPVAPVHILVIPKMKIATINDLEDKDMELIGEIVLTAKKLAFERGIQDSGYRLIWNTNGHGQQTVYHIHLHLIGGKQLSWNF